MGRVMEALEKELHKKENLWAIYAIRLLLMTGCRRNEILTLKWGEVTLNHYRTGSRVLRNSNTHLRS